MAANQEKITFSCVIESMHKTQPSIQKEVTEEKNEILKSFKATIRSQLNIFGDMTFYRPKQGNKTPTRPEEKITDLTQPLQEVLGLRKILFIIYDEKKSVAAGGAGMGAQAKSVSGTGVHAQGGIGYGGSIDANGNAQGGHGLGGDGRGERIIGVGGRAFGGNANVTRSGSKAAAGKGVGGEAVDDHVNKGK